MKDNFSRDAGSYAQFRPSYPDALFDWIAQIRTGAENAWDCGTGNGQAAVRLAPLYRHVFATDISAAQLAHAAWRPNVYYSQQAAEQTDFGPDMFDLIVVAQAVHWFDFDAFYAEVRGHAGKTPCLLFWDTAACVPDRRWTG